ncbi:MAG: SPFH domain-containing protein, partial [Rhodococcus sp. (in: high G+C Gram-positive bacteria)]
MCSSACDLREQVIRIPPTWVSAQDDLPVFVATVLHFRVSDAQAVAYAVADHHAALQQLATTTLGNLVAQLPREDVVAWSGGLGEGLRNVLNDAAARWGLRVDRAELT